MIKVNLLPSKKQEKTRPKPGRRGAAPAGPAHTQGMLVTLAVILVAFGVAGFYIRSVYVKVSDAAAALQTAKEKHAKLEKQVKELEKEVSGLAELSSMLKNEMAALSALMPPDRVIWAEKLRQLASAAPDDIFFTAIRVTEITKEELTEESSKALKAWQDGGRKGPKPPERKRVTIQQTLNIDGIAYAKDAIQRPQVMLDFYEKLRGFAEPRPGQTAPTPFMRGFQPTVEILPYDNKFEVDGVEVCKFTFKIPAITRVG